jgi:hypothetical protein
MDRFSVIYYELRTDEDGLSESTLGLYKQADVSLFPLILRCTATVQERTWERMARASLARLSNQMLAQDHEPGNAAGMCFISTQVFFFFFFFFQVLKGFIVLLKNTSN